MQPGIIARLLQKDCTGSGEPRRAARPRRSHRHVPCARRLSVDHCREVSPFASFDQHRNGARYMTQGSCSSASTDPRGRIARDIAEVIAFPKVVDREYGSRLWRGPRRYARAFPRTAPPLPLFGARLVVCSRRERFLLWPSASGPPPARVASTYALRLRARRRQVCSR